MKHNTYRWMVLLWVLIQSTLSFAYNAEVNGIYYNLNTSAKTASVTYRTTDYGSYSGKIVISTSTSSNEYQGSKRIIHVATAGTLPNYISDLEKYTIEELTLTGELNGTDFRLLRDMAGNNYLGQDTEGKLRKLDFSGAKIVVGGECYLSTSNISNIAYGSFYYDVTNNNVVPEAVFCYCDLENVNISNTATRIGDEAFSCCSALTSITIPKSVTSIGDDAFSHCGLTSITIPNSVTSIGEYAFYFCRGLTSITIPNSVTNIGKYAFGECSGLNSVHISDLAAWCKINFGYYFANPLCCAHHLYLNGKEVKDLVIPNNVTSIGNNAFYGCFGLTSLTIPNNVKSIGEYAFGNCSGLTSITIANSVTNNFQYFGVFNNRA